MLPLRQSGVPIAVLRFSIVNVLFTPSVVNAPVDLVVAPIEVPFMVPPVTVTPLDVKLFAVTDPPNVRVSVEDPIFIASGVVLFVPIFMVLPVLNVPILIKPFASVPWPAFIVTSPPVDPAAVVVPAIKLRSPPVGEVVELAGFMEIAGPPVRVVMSAALFPAR